MSVCCIIGHRTISEAEGLRLKVIAAIKNLIEHQRVTAFLFGSKSRFNDLCYEVVSEWKETYPNIKRIYARAEFPNIDDNYLAYLLERYEETYFPKKLLQAGRAVYVERNFEMIQNSDYCLFYYDNTLAPTSRKSGTKIALDYAIAQKKKIILLRGSISDPVFPRQE